MTKMSMMRLAALNVLPPRGCTQGRLR
jgi:hypothetical protein